MIHTIFVSSTAWTAPKSLTTAKDILPAFIPQIPIFFGSLAAEDQLSYDYSQDPRTIRYRKHTEKMRAANQEASKKHHVSSDMSFFVITGSRQGRR